MKMPLREIGRVDHHPQSSIHNAMKGVSYDYNFSGQRVGSVGHIELCVTSIVTDWNNNIFYRTCRYLGHHEGWKAKVKGHIFQHLSELGVGIMLVRAMMNDFEVDKSRHQEWIIDGD